MTVRTFLVSITLLASLSLSNAAQADVIFKGTSKNSTLDGVTTADTVLGKDKLNTSPSVSFDKTLPQNDLAIAVLTLTLNPKASGTQDVNYDLILNLTKPSPIVFDAPSISLHLRDNGLSGANSIITISGFSGLGDLALPDHIILSNFQFSLEGVAPATFDRVTDTWTIDGTTNTSALLVSADVAVPEPMSLALLGGALVAFAGIAVRRRMRHG